MFAGFIIALILTITVEAVMIVDLMAQNRVFRANTEDQTRFDKKVKDIEEKNYKELLAEARKACATTTDEKIVE